MVCRTMQLERVVHIGRGVVEIHDSAVLERATCCRYRVMRAATERMFADLAQTAPGHSA